MDVYGNFRSKEVLLSGFDDLTTLLRYLYMDDTHSVVVSNGVCKLKIAMTPGLDFLCWNFNFPDLPPMRREMSLSELFGIIEQLKTLPAEEFPERFKNRWDEIATMTNANMSLNFDFKLPPR